MQNRLLRLLRDNAQAKAKRPLNLVLPKAGDTSPDATIYVYDVIVADETEAEYWGGVSPMGFLKALATAALAADTIHVRFNCPGGDVFAGRAMEAALRGCMKKTVAHVDGYAASAASYLALACDEVEIAQGGFFMIHKAWTMGWGNSDDFQSTAAVLDKIDASLADTYAKETNLEADVVLGLMAAETWVSAQEAVDMGFADRIAGDAPKGCAGWNLTAYVNAPKTEPRSDEDPATALEPPAEPNAGDVLSGETNGCTSGGEAGLEEPTGFDSAYFEQRDRRLRYYERCGR